jgi:adenylate cyclase class IV
MVKLMMSTGQVKKLTDFFDGYEDDKVKVTLDKVQGIRAIMNCETELTAQQAADHCKAIFKGTAEGKILYFSIAPEGAY